MNQDLTQSNLSVTRDGVTINISGPAWLIKDVYDRETGNPIRVEQATPDAPAAPKEWPVFRLGDRVRYAGSSLVGTIEGTDRGPRFYSVRYDGGGLQEHMGMMLIKVDDEPQAEPTIEALAQQEPESKPKPVRKGRKNWLMSRTPEERSAHGRMMMEAKRKKQARTFETSVATEALPNVKGVPGEDGLVRIGRNGRINVLGTLCMMSVGDRVFIPGGNWDTVRLHSKRLGYVVRTKVTQKGVRVWRVQ